MISTIILMDSDYSKVYSNADTFLDHEQQL